jgi:hypothetical protein
VFSVYGLVFMVWCLWFWVYGLVFMVLGLWFWDYGFGFSVVCGFGFMVVSGFGFMVFSGFGFRRYGFVLGVSRLALVLVFAVHGRHLSLDIDIRSRRPVARRFCGERNVEGN